MKERPAVVRDHWQSAMDTRVRRAPTTLAAVCMFLVFFFIPSNRTSAQQVRSVADLTKSDHLVLPHNATGPESIAFDGAGGGPYTGVSEGTVLRWDGEARRWEEFAVPQHRLAECNDPQSDPQETVCGRPLGLQFHRATGDLYIADAYFGLLVAGPGGGVASQIATEADGETFRFTNGLDIDQKHGVAYFTDSSTRFQRRDFPLIEITGDATGRLLRYNTDTKEVAVLLRGLAFPNGVAMSGDGAFLLVAESTNHRLLRYWLRGPMAGEMEVFADLPGYPDNVKRNPKGEFWVALSPAQPTECQVAARLSGDGVVVEVLEECGAEGAVSEVEERNGTLWFGSVVRPYVDVYSV